MGNGQNRHRRGGARTRHGPHRGGASSGDRRNTTQLISPARVASADATADADEETIHAPVAMSEPADDSERADEAEPEASSAISAPTDQEPDAERDAAPAEGQSPAASEELEEAAAPEPPEPRAPRGRFERFYAPGQGTRVESESQQSAATQGERAGAGRAPTPHPAPAPQPAPQRPQVAAHIEDDEEEPTVSGPREDVRGAVGALIDSLHDLFSHDRTVASQGGSSRCGICYFHYPLSELTYRDEEGFYVCHGCERSLGSARVSMVRRQQRQ